MRFRITLTLLALGLCEQVSGCKCDGTPTVNEAYKMHSVIVNGVVISKKLVSFGESMDRAKAEHVKIKLKNENEKLQQFLAYSVYEIRILVKESFKGGHVGDTLTIYTGTSSCGFRFQLDKEYIVYTLKKSWHYLDFLNELVGNEKFEKENTYWVHKCTRTTGYDNAEALGLKNLRNKKD